MDWGCPESKEQIARSMEPTGGALLPLPLAEGGRDSIFIVSPRKLERIQIIDGWTDGWMDRWMKRWMHG